MASQSAAAYMAAQAPECASVMALVAPATSCNAKPSSAKPLKKSKSKAVSKVKPSLAHPTYLQMSAEAISALKERTGSSHYAIAKWLEDKYKGSLPANFKKQLHLQLKRQTENGKLIQIKNSYKLSDELKKCTKKLQMREQKHKNANRENTKKKCTSVHIKKKAIKLSIKSTACKKRSSDSKKATQKPLKQAASKPMKKMHKCEDSKDISKAKLIKSAGKRAKANIDNKQAKRAKTKSIKTVIKKTVKVVKPATKRKSIATQKNSDKISAKKAPVCIEQKKKTVLKSAKNPKTKTIKVQ